MDKDFDFDNIGKRTPYRTPQNKKHLIALPITFLRRHSVRYWNVRLANNARSVG